MDRRPEVACWTARDRVLGVPIGREEYIKNHLAKKSDEHQVLVDRIPLVQDLQAEWLLLFYCAGSRATFWLWSVRPQFTADFVDAHDRQNVGMFQSVGGDRKSLGESAAVHHDSFVT